jgi:hypothetical protein
MFEIRDLQSRKSRNEELCDLYVSSVTQEI